MSERARERLHFYLIAFEFGLAGGGVATGSGRRGWPEQYVSNARLDEVEQDLRETIRSDGREVASSVALSVSYLGHMTAEEMGT